MLKGCCVGARTLLKRMNMCGDFKLKGDMCGEIMKDANTCGEILSKDYLKVHFMRSNCASHTFGGPQIAINHEIRQLYVEIMRRVVFAATINVYLTNLFGEYSN